MGRGAEQTFSQEEIQVGSMNIKRCSTSLIISETKIKTIIRYHLTPVRMDIIRNTTSNKYWQGCEEKVTLKFYYWEYKLAQPQWETVLRFFRKTKNRTTVCVHSSFWLFSIPWTVAHWAPLSVGFPRQEYWSGLPFASPGDLPNLGVEWWLLLHLLHCRWILSHWGPGEAPKFPRYC